MNKILITGGAGYIGSVLVNQLIKDKSNKITVVDNLIFEQSSLDMCMKHHDQVSRRQ